MLFNKLGCTPNVQRTALAPGSSSSIFNASNYFKSRRHHLPLLGRLWLRCSWGFHGAVLQRIPFQQKLDIAFLAEGGDGRSKRSLRNMELFLVQQLRLLRRPTDRSRASVPG